MVVESLGIIETSSISASLKIVNEIKSIEGIKFVGKHILGEGIVSVFIKGNLGALSKALKTGAECLKNADGFRGSHIIPMPHKDLLSKFNLERNEL